MEREVDRVIASDGERVGELRVTIGHVGVDEGDGLGPLAAGWLALVGGLPRLPEAPIGRVEGVVGIADETGIRRADAEDAHVDPFGGVVWPRGASVLDVAMMRAEDDVEVACAIGDHRGAAVVIEARADVPLSEPFARVAVVGGDHALGLAAEPREMRPPAPRHDLVAERVSSASGRSGGRERLLLNGLSHADRPLNEREKNDGAGSHG